MTQNAKDLQFISLVSMFAEMAMQHLGKTANPVSQKVEKNMQAAKMTIDMLLMLKEKTSGNLTQEEETFLTSILTNLQLNYVDEQNASPSKDGA